MSMQEIVHPDFLARVAEPKVRTFVHLREFPEEKLPAEKKSSDLLEAFGFKQTQIEKAEIVPLRVFPELKLFSAYVKPRDFLDLLREALAQIVSFVEPVPRVKALLKDTVPLVGGDIVWDEGYTGKGVKVAVVDSGVWSDHPELRGKVIAAKSFVEGEDAGDYRGHGTHVAGIIASNGEVYRGVAPGVSIVNAKGLNKDNDGNLDDLIAGIMWSVKDCKADIVNMSFGVSVPDHIEAALKLSTWMLDRMRQGVIFVAAAGNEGEFRYGTINFPAIAPGVIAVAASDKRLRVTYYSSKGSERIEKMIGELKPTITAPGGLDKMGLSECVISTFPAYIDRPWKIDGIHAGLVGTSMAAPHVSGGLALLLEALKERGIEGGERYSLATGAIIHTATKLKADRYMQGWGFLNLPEALKNLGKFRYTVPPPESVEGLRRYLLDLQIETLSSVALDVVRPLIGLGILSLAISEFLGVKSSNFALTLNILREMFEKGYISQQQFILAISKLLQEKSF